MENTKQNISIKDIAAEAGVSIATVSRIINKTGRYSKQTEERVMEIIQRNHFEPNRIAIGLRAQKMNNVGIITPDITNEFFTKLIYRVEKELYKAGYESFLCNTYEDEELEKKRVRTMLSQNVCGLLVLTGNRPDTEDRALPTVYIDREPAGDGVVAVTSDNVAAGFLAGKRLVAAGCRRPLMMTCSEAISGYDERVAGFRQAMLEAGIELTENSIVGIDRLHYQEAYDKMNELLDRDGLCWDGIFGASDWLAVGCYQSLKEHGITVPGQVKLMGCDDISIIAFNEVPISTIHQQVDIVARQAVERLVAMMNGVEVAPDTIRVPVYETLRRSTEN